MRARVFGTIFLLLALLLILTPWYIFPVCKVGRYAPPDGVSIGAHGCHDTLKAETVLGGLAIIIGALPLIWPRRKALLGASLAAVATGALAALFPAAITGTCKVPTMPCNTGTLPALVILGACFAAAGLAGILASRKTP